MAAKSSTTKVPMTNANILSAVRSTLGYEVQNHMPEDISDNIQRVYSDIMEIQPLRNAIVPALVQRIGLQTIDTLAWTNPLAMYKKDPMRYGSTQEEIFVNMCKGKVYDPRESYEYAFQLYQSYIMAAFHKVNLQIQYPVTVTFDNLRNAFTSEYGIRDMISAKMQSAVTAANWDEYLAMKQLIDAGYDAQVLPARTVSAVTNEETAKAMLVEVKTAVGEFRFPLPTNNIAGATSASEPFNLIFITTPRVNANISVEALAYAFNMDKADVEVRTVIVDSFENPAIQGVLVDARFFNCREQFREISDQRIANILSWNYFYTMVEMISASPFYPVRVFTTDQVAEPTTLTVTAGTYTAGGEVQIKAALSGGTGTYHQELIDYEITSGATSRDTYIVPGTNILHTGSDETGTLVITATYRPTPTVTGTANFTAGA